MRGHKILTIQYCNSCLFPETKPNIYFDINGVCSACNNYKNRSKVNWKEREREFLRFIKKQKKISRSDYDCVVPVSGGKDSIYQVIKCLELGLKPLCINAATCDFSEIGKKNFDVMCQLGVDVITVNTNKKVRAKLNNECLRLVGDIAWPEHVSIYTIPVKIALSLGINVLIWGENPQNEYGGPKATQGNRVRDRKWLEEYGGMGGLRISDLINQNIASENEMSFFRYPELKEIKKINFEGIYLGYYFPWDGFKNYETAKMVGFIDYGKSVEGSYFSYENLDNHQHGIHDYFKFIKYGYGRATDQASILIRRKLISREEGVKFVKKHDGKFPWKYLGKSLKDILGLINMTIKEFTKISDQYTNPLIFKNKNGKFLKDKKLNLTKNNYDNLK
jgi:N-acetyl sugar amidotransferase|tara:strand:- start:486 stop:1658 length:1173 start_codon:yes stop_codon:yes gene_type:complete